MKKNTALLVAGIIFVIFALIHLLRVLFAIEIVASGYVVPQSLSVVAVIIALVLALWMFMARLAK